MARKNATKAPRHKEYTANIIQSVKEFIYLVVIIIVLISISL